MKFASLACTLACSTILTVHASADAHSESWTESVWSMIATHLSPDNRALKSSRKRDREVLGRPSGEACEVCVNDDKQ